MGANVNLFIWEMKYCTHVNRTFGIKAPHQSSARNVNQVPWNAGFLEIPCSQPLAAKVYCSLPVLKHYELTQGPLTL